MRALKLVMLWLMGLFYLLAGLNHFAHPDFYVRIMPDYLPWHRELVYVSGTIEMELGLLVLVPRYRVDAAWGLIALLIAVFPANLNMTLHPEQFRGFSQAMLWGRLPVQAVLIAWAFWFTRPMK